MDHPQKTSRRRFLGQAAAAIAAPTIIPASVLGENAPSKRVAMGFIGMGNRGIGVMEALLRNEHVQGVAVCDPHDRFNMVRNGNRSRDYGSLAGKEAMEKMYSENAPSGSWKGCDAVADFREIIARDDIDAFLVATPDHWHGIITMEALLNGKDVYCEKPVTHKFAEGLHLHRAASKLGRIVQVGSQQRSEKVFQQAVEIVRNGLIGKVERVEVGLPKGHNEPESDPSEKAPPAGLDYDLWCGPAELLPYVEARHHWSWRWTTTYGGGQLMDWIGHHNDIAHWGLDQDRGGPVTIEARDWVFPETPLYDAPMEYDVVSTYDDGVEVLISSRLPMGAKWIGENGWVHVTRGKLEASNTAWTADDFVAGDWKTYKTPGHQRNFIDCVLSREAPICDAESAHRSITPGHLAAVAHAQGQAVKWDPASESIVGDEEAQAQLMALPYRGDWELRTA